MGNKCDETVILTGKFCGGFLFNTKAELTETNTSTMPFIVNLSIIFYLYDHLIYNKQGA